MGWAVALALMGLRQSRKLTLGARSASRVWGAGGGWQLRSTFPNADISRTVAGIQAVAG